ncbi:MAG: hypothetical protein LW878_03990 [Proteobacteria bacterium]|jgi:hypothetical protein|nr:hypothetical protein [Pseudomonadota bacterium]
MQKLVLILASLALTQSAFAYLTVEDKNKLATVTLHTELIEASKRVYLAADFEAKHDKGVIGCDLKITHQNGQNTGPVYHLEETTSLMPKEMIPFNLGLFPERFHASGLDVKAVLVCRRVTFFDQRKGAKPLLKATTAPEPICCRMSNIALNCASQPDGSIELKNTTQLTLLQKDPRDYPSCWPVED